MYILPNIISRAQPLDPGVMDFKFLIEASQKDQKSPRLHNTKTNNVMNFKILLVASLLILTTPIVCLQAKCQLEDTGKDTEDN